MPNRDQQEANYQMLISQHQRQLYDHIFAIFPNHSAADDILQETNRVLWEKRSKFTLGTNFLAWARRIAQLQTLSFLKQNKRKSWLCFDSELVKTLAEAIENRDADRERRARALKHCVALLSENDQRLVNLRYDKELSHRQISGKTSRSEGALKQVFRRIRSQLKDCIERRTLSESDKVDEF